MLEFGERLGKILKSRNMTRKKLAEKIGVTPSTVSNYIHEKRQPGLETLEAMAKALNVSTDYLLGKIDDHLSEAELSEQELLIYESLKKLPENVKRSFVNMLIRSV